MSEFHRAKKSLGQNFLISPAPLRTMLEGAKVDSRDTVLEIGPGKGVLTEVLLATGATVIAVEKDDSLIPLLQEKFVKEIGNKQLNLIHGDVLAKNLKLESYLLKPNSYKLIANIPYYITGEIIRKFLESEHQPQTMALIVQKEVAERIVAKDGKESILSISVKVYGKPKYLGTVKRGLFRPIPNVDSAVLLIENISKENFAKLEEIRFFEIVKAGFAHKRKKLYQNIKHLNITENVLEIYRDRRAEKLSVDDWKILASNIESSN